MGGDDGAAQRTDEGGTVVVGNVVERKIDGNEHGWSSFVNQIQIIGGGHHSLFVAGGARAAATAATAATAGACLS